MLFNVDTKKTQAITGDISTEATKLLLFECQSGLCTRTAGYVKDGKETPNFYELTTSVSKLMIATDYAESCTTENSGKLVTTTNKLCINIGNSDVKEIDFPGSSGRYIISSGNSGFKTIRTVSGIISMNGIIESNYKKNFELKWLSPIFFFIIDIDIFKNFFFLFYFNFKKKSFI